MGDTIITREQLRQMAKEERLRPEDVFPVDILDEYYKDRRLIDKMEAELKSEKERAAMGLPGIPGEGSSPASIEQDGKISSTEETDDLPAHCDPRRNPLIRLTPEG